ncbi:hypothetical protein [Bordetella sp. FB-8]|uniref:hypothetical protein n=1 Tax=Bordetella sp. FB-8 TaxID=1159870 RepID=UPI000379FBFD|nr:hypothetical protein [Bordetella sp. FB-8]
MRRQQGQALVESVFALAALLACACAIAWTGSAWHRVMQAAQASRAAAFLAARGGSPAARQDDVGLGLLRNQAGPVPADAKQAQLQQDWLRADARLVTVQAERKIHPPVGWTYLSVGDVTVHRHTSVAQAGGHAVSDMDGQRRIIDSRVGWQAAAGLSQSLAHRLRSGISGVDGAWGGRKPDTDWVSAWSQLMPVDRLASGRRP